MLAMVCFGMVSVRILLTPNEIDYKLIAYQVLQCNRLRLSFDVFTYLICNALVPNTLARSYLVMYGVVLRFSSGIFFSLSPTTAFLFPDAPPPPPPVPSPTATIAFPLTLACGVLALVPLASASGSSWRLASWGVRAVPSGFSMSSGSCGSKGSSSS